MPKVWSHPFSEGAKVPSASRGAFLRTRLGSNALCSSSLIGLIGEDSGECAPTDGRKALGTRDAPAAFRRHPLILAFSRRGEGTFEAGSSQGGVGPVPWVNSRQAQSEAEKDGGDAPAVGGTSSPPARCEGIEVEAIDGAGRCLTPPL